MVEPELPFSIRGLLRRSLFKPAAHVYRSVSDVQMLVAPASGLLCLALRSHAPKNARIRADGREPKVLRS